jgi:uncharacterized oxidoreductase
LQEASNKFVVQKSAIYLLKQKEMHYNWVLENHSDLNVLVNNAGIQNWMTVSDDFYEKATAEITTNIVAPLHLTSLL